MKIDNELWLLKNRLCYQKTMENITNAQIGFWTPDLYGFMFQNNPHCKNFA